MYRRLLILLAGLLAVAPARAIEPVGDLRALGADAARRGVPIVLAVTRDECGYCETLKREILEPMALAGDDPRRVLIRELDVDSGGAVVGFDGTPTTAGVVAGGYDAMFTPTLLFVGPDGAEIAERMVGINTPEMYGWYLDRAIDAAAASLPGTPDDPAAAPMRP
jgi:thioredoxin-related protein